jgi:hypothetical protein
MGGDLGFGRPWLALTGALALHVTDEALTGFLDRWNALVLRLGGSFPWSMMPTFSFSEWIGGLILAVVVLALLSTVAATGARWLRPLGYLYGIVMLLNGVGHLTASLLVGRPVPGTYSAPFLLVCSIWLLVRLIRARAARP